MMSINDFREKQIMFVLLEEGEKLSFKNDNIIVSRSDGTTKHQSTCYLLFAVFVAGHYVLTSGLMERAKKFGFSIVFMNYSMRVYAILPASMEGNVLLRKKQYEYNSLELGAYIIQNKIHNQRGFLNEFRIKTYELKTAITNLEELEKTVRSPNLSLAEIMGKEGAASKQYFACIFAGHNWTARRPRVKHDMANCLLDIGYMLLFNIVHGLLEIYGFDTYMGVLHRQFYQRKSLVCDIVEPFRPIVDKALKNALNLGQCKEKDFIVQQGQWSVYGKNAAPYIKMFITAILEYKETMFSYVQSYYRAFMRSKKVDDFPFAIL